MNRTGVRTRRPKHVRTDPDDLAGIRDPALERLLSHPATLAEEWPEAPAARRQPFFVDVPQPETLVVPYWMRSMRSVADTGRCPPAIGVTVSALGLSVGFRTVSRALSTVVRISTVAVIWVEPAARPATV